jgi:uncharacterized protein with PIN domain
MLGFNSCSYNFILNVHDLGSLNFLLNLWKKFDCPLCNKRFRKIEDSMQHEQVIHGTGKIYTCNKCNLKFFGMQQMRDHIKIKHQYNKNKKTQ